MIPFPNPFALIERGAKALDQVDPTWITAVAEAMGFENVWDFDNFDISSEQKCVLGVSFNQYTRGLDALGITNVDAWKYGFDFYSGHDVEEVGDRFSIYGPLQVCWEYYVAERLNEHRMAILLERYGKDGEKARNGYYVS